MPVKYSGGAFNDPMCGEAGIGRDCETPFPDAAPPLIEWASRGLRIGIGRDACILLLLFGQERTTRLY